MEQGPHTTFAIVAHEIFDGFAFRGPGAILVEGDRIAALTQPGQLGADVARIDLPADATLAPGFIDCQVNGGGGVLVNDDPSEDAIRKVVEAHQCFGTTSMLPTLITDAGDRMEALSRIDPRTIQGVPGFHLEGPFINVDRRGVHRAGHVRDLAPADLECLAAFGEQGCCLLTLAPERVAPGVIAALCDLGVVVSIGHSNATAACVRDAADEGARGVTHLFNAMSQITPREPGVVGAALVDERLVAGVIADGLHVAAANLMIAARLLGPGRMMLVSDAMPSVGARQTSFSLMEREVSLHEGRLSLDDGTLAGAHLTMAEGVKRLVRLAGVAKADALRMATRTPADFLGLEQEIGALRSGAYADLVALDADLDVTHVWLRGAPVAARRLGPSGPQP